MSVTLLVVATAWVAQTTAQCLSSDDSGPLKNPASNLDFQKGHLQFSLNLFSYVAELHPEDNVFVAPASIYNAMILAYFISAGDTEQSLQKLLFGSKNQEKKEILLSFRLINALSKGDGYSSQVRSTERVFISKNQNVRDCMLEMFDDDIEDLDFKNAIERINLWVTNRTGGNIQDLVSTNDIRSSTQLVLASAAYFKGVWKNQFDSRSTRAREFKVNKNKTVQVPMMFQRNSFKHWRSNELEAEILVLPYKEYELGFIVLLPDEKKSEEKPAATLLRGLDRETLLTIIRESNDLKNEDMVEVMLPKFTAEKTLELTSTLKAMGVGDLFQPTSNLTTLTGPWRVSLDSAIHKAKIQVDERGLETAAAFLLPTKKFYCDRPFVYLLFNQRSNQLLFTGILNDPTK